MRLRPSSSAINQGYDVTRFLLRHASMLASVKVLNVPSHLYVFLHLPFTDSEKMFVSMFACFRSFPGLVTNRQVTPAKDSGIE